MRVAIKRGTKIVCPLCGETVGEVAKDLHFGDIVDVDNIRIYGAEVRKGEELRCPKCNFPLAVDTRVGALIHTEKGWMPGRIPTNAFLPFVVAYLQKTGMWEGEWDKYFEE